MDPASSIIREAVVKIGHMKHPLRLIEMLDSEGNRIRMVCNDAIISTQEISDLYRTRWQIELFFKRAKQHLVLKKLHGKEPKCCLQPDLSSNDRVLLNVTDQASAWI